jgi:hypothetical protein
MMRILRLTPQDDNATCLRAFMRIAVTLPRRVLSAVDARAVAINRSRSWVIAEAIRRYTSEPLADPAGPISKRPGLGESRLRQLAADLRLSPEERVREAEETARATERRGRARRHVIIAFDRYEDYLDWKRR